MAYSEASIHCHIGPAPTENFLIHRIHDLRSTQCQARHLRGEWGAWLGHLHGQMMPACESLLRPTSSPGARDAPPLPPASTLLLPEKGETNCCPLWDHTTGFRKSECIL